MPVISRLACTTYYRLNVSGQVPRTGPVLVVANHSNSLMDPALVVFASGRMIRFMAKNTLLTHKQIGWLVRAVGSVPVYRQIDDPKLVTQNFDSFSAVHEAIAHGDAVGIFPEGTSHSASRLQPLKTGPARNPVGGAKKRGHAFPIVPVGLVFRDRRTFRSSARVIIGVSCEWSDLADRGSSDKEAVRELTRRIDASLRTVTLNLRSWADEQLVRCAERVWAAEFGAAQDGREELERLRATTDALALLRMGEHTGWRRVARELRAHDRILARLHLTPSTLRARPTIDASVSWVIERFPLLVMLPLAAVGLVLFFVPREITGLVAGKMARAEGEDAVPTFRVLYGAAIFLFWFILLAVAAGMKFGGWVGLLTFALLPLLAYAGLKVGDSQRLSWLVVRRFFIMRFQRARIANLRERQSKLAESLRLLFDNRQTV